MRNPFRILLLLVATGARAAQPASTPAPPDPVPAPPVEELVTLALGRSPSLQSLRHRIEVAREMVAPAGALADPMVEVMFQDVSFPEYTVGTMDMSMIGPEVRQVLPFPGKRAARRAAARAEVDVHLDELSQVRRQLVAGVRQIYARVYALDQERAALVAARQLLDMLAATAAMRYSVGEAEQEAVIKAQIEVSRIEERTDDVEAERATLVSGLNRLLDQPGAPPLGLVGALPRPTVPPGPWEDAMLASSAEVAARRAAVVAAQRRADVARLDLRPDFTTGAAVGLRGGFDPVVTLRVGVEVPLWRQEKQRPVIRAAEHEIEMARADLRDAEATVRSEAARLRAEWDRAQRQVTRYREAVIPQSSAAIDAARTSYLAGRGDFLTVIEDFRLWLDARAELARREAARYATWAEIDALTRDPEPDTGAPDPVPQAAQDERERPAGTDGREPQPEGPPQQSRPEPALGRRGAQ